MGRGFCERCPTWKQLSVGSSGRNKLAWRVRISLRPMTVLVYINEQQQSSTLYMRAVLLTVVSCLAAAAAHESCCEKAARLAKQRQIPDPEAEPPEVDASGQPRLIPNASEIQPELWDDEDDGPWEPPWIVNPLYEWHAPLIDNPDYKPPTFLQESQSEVQKALPWLVLGVLISAATEPLQLAQKLGPLLSGAGPLGGALLGLATPLCSCGALPVAAGLVRSGVPLSAVASFLTASQSAGLDSAAITWGLLGPVAALWRLGGAFVLAVVAGVAATAGVSVAAGARESSSAGRVGGGRLVGQGAWAGGGLMAFLRALCVAAVQSATDTFPPVLLGLLLSAAATRWLPSLPSAPQELGGADGCLRAPPRSLLTLALALALALTLTSALTLARRCRWPACAPRRTRCRAAAAAVRAHHRHGRCSHPTSRRLGWPLLCLLAIGTRHQPTQPLPAPLYALACRGGCWGDGAAHVHTAGASPPLLALRCRQGLRRSHHHSTAAVLRRRCCPGGP